MIESYFAYGSNMSSRRLFERVSGARVVGRAVLDDHRLSFNKPSRDGSGKANLVPAAGRITWGVVFDIPRAGWPLLDRFEPDYRRIATHVRLDSGALHPSQVYVYEAGGDELEPFDWYLAHLIEGAREHALPQDVVAALRQVRSRRGALR